MSLSIFARSILGLAVGATSALVVATPVSGQGDWQTTLKARDIDGNGTIDAYYDTALNITWLADANSAYTSGYTSEANGGVASDAMVYGSNVRWADGRMGGDVAKAWADDLVVGTYSDWRLPSVRDSNGGCVWGRNTQCGYNVSTITSELAHMYYVTLGDRGYIDASGVYDPTFGLSNTGPFSNVQSGHYWSGVEYAPYSGHAWYFDMDRGYQNGYNKNYAFYAWAVHDGDVAVVPEPESWALALVGLAVAGWTVRRRA
jgi:MYXO-CTERM domain-containing protein